MPESTIIALLGAESTGKTTLTRSLEAALKSEGVDVVVVPELLRGFCERHGRTPRVDEQAALAHAQSASIRDAASRHAVVLADTSALLTACYSALLFADPSLMPGAVREHRHYALSLLTGLDLPWVADGIQRDGPQARDAFDAALRAHLLAHGLPFSVVYGSGERRGQLALAAVRRCLRPAPDATQPRWRWTCSHCGDAACEAASLRLAR